MGMTIGQGLILGAQNYINAQETERRRKWEDEERARQRKAWAARDTTMTQLANADKEQVVGDVPVENWQDPPVTQRRSAIDPQQLYERQQRILATSEDPAFMTQGIGMYPQVEQAKELAYQRNERAAANAIVKQHSDMRDVLLESWNGVEQGTLAPSVFLGMMSKAVGFQKANSLVIAGLPGSEQYMITDENGKGQFAPVTKEDARKIFEQADEYLRAKMENALRGVSAEHAFKSEKRGLERQQVGAAVTSAEASRRTADAAWKRALSEESLLPEQREVLRKHALYYGSAADAQSANADYIRAGKGAINDEKVAKAERQRAITAAADRYEVLRGILAQNKDLQGNPLTPETRARFEREAQGVSDRLLLLQGKDPKEDRNVDAYQKAVAKIIETTGALPSESVLIGLRTEFGLEPNDVLMDALRRSNFGAQTAPAAKTKADVSNAEAQKVARIARMGDAELQAIAAMNPMLAPYAQRELDIRRGKAQRTQAVPPPPYIGALPDNAPPLR